MILNAFSIKDTKIGLFNRPFFEANNLTAIRSFSSLVGDNQTLMHKYPADFELWSVGQFDEAEGIFTGRPQMVITGIDLKNSLAVDNVKN